MVGQNAKSFMVFGACFLKDFVGEGEREPLPIQELFIYLRGRPKKKMSECQTKAGNQECLIFMCKLKSEYL